MTAVTVRSAASGQIDLTRPSCARLYDYYLGGSHNFAIDREYGRQAIAQWPQLPAMVRANRDFLRRAVRFAVRNGIRQFLDIGSGIPTAGNVHEVARRADPGARVVYVDIDPVAVAHSRAMLAGCSGVTVLQADLRDAQTVLRDSEVRRVIDFSRPVALLTLGVLHQIPDADDPKGLLREYHDALAPGSLMVISHGANDIEPERAYAHQRLYAGFGTPLWFRERSQVLDLFGDFEVLEPGVVPLPEWRPDSCEADAFELHRMSVYGGMGRKN
ncbi:SAM-dependent methyltransferase [Allokutzneria sp. A3M-2-11 16]|uniref:SAM-dependent methyltransferase n=1 Tax=Allokutzneria sp. A3M-2-11 16 TaxID=2962043 RepID=UPI0020B75480|nr:SAM-dependent methyltransferase [Allokutzneria sp. A3M-2-11 16]MCP3799216.1 SAM-dependent methyltransferase [Allokutzneria sp. A3M-2-11 16]